MTIDHKTRRRSSKEERSIKEARSKDGTAIAFDTSGQGPAVILVDGAFGSRSFGPNEPLALLLARHFTVITYDRRGRGDSGDTPPYAVEREVEDIEALIREARGSAFVYGISSGAALALEAAARGLAIKKLALYEAPFIVDDSRPPLPDDYMAQLTEMIAADRRGDAVNLFMAKVVLLPGILVALMRFMPAWSHLKAVVHTVIYDSLIVKNNQRGRPLQAQQWASVTVPTLVVVGGKSQAWMRHAMQALADVLPNAKHRILEGQTHLVKTEVLAPVLAEFFAGTA